MGHKKDAEAFPEDRENDYCSHLYTIAKVCQLDGDKPILSCAQIPKEMQEEIHKEALAELEKEDAAAEEEEEEEEEEEADEERNEVQLALECLEATEHAHPSPPNKVTTLVPRSNKRKREDDEQQAQHENKKKIQVVDLCSSDDE